MNVELFQRIKTHILEEPRRIEMYDWIIKKEERPGYFEVRGDNAPPCGTAACIAGWALLLTKPNAEATHDIEVVARRILGITPMQARHLFGVGGWPQEFADAYRNGDAVQRAQVTADRIDHFIRTGGNE